MPPSWRRCCGASPGAAAHEGRAMKGLALDVHSWRGVWRWRAEPDLFHFRVTLGFVTLWLCKFCVGDRLNALARMMDGR